MSAQARVDYWRLTTALVVVVPVVAKAIVAVVAAVATAADCNASPSVCNNRNRFRGRVLMSWFACQKLILVNGWVIVCCIEL